MTVRDWAQELNEMQGMSLFKGAVVALATFGVVCPQATAAAAGQTAAAKPVVHIARAGAVANIRTAKTGVFAGRVVDHNGSPIKGAEVVVRRDAKEVTRIATDDRGVFQVGHLENGDYQVASGGTEGNFRVWNDGSAPATADEYALIVQGEDGARGQYGGMGNGMLLLTAAVIAAIIIAVIAIDQNDDDNNDIVNAPPQSL